MTLQQGHGGWNPRMSDYLGKIGTVHRITEKGDIRYAFKKNLIIYHHFGNCLS